MTAARRSALAVLVGLACVLLISGGIFWVKVYRMFVIHTGSMEPTLKLGTLVVTKPAGLGYGPGDVITFRHSDVTTDVVTHRVFSIDRTGIATKGNANPTPDAWTIRPDQVQGVRWLTFPRVGFVLVFLQQPTGLAALVTALLGMIVLWGLFFPTEVMARVQRQARHRRSGPSRRRFPAAPALHMAAPARTSLPTPRLPALAQVEYADAPTTVISRADVDARQHPFYSTPNLLSRRCYWSTELAQILEHVVRHSVGDVACELLWVSLTRDLMAIVDRRSVELMPHLPGRIEVGEPVIGPCPDPFETHLERWEQQRVVQAGKICSCEEGR